MQAKMQWLKDPNQNNVDNPYSLSLKLVDIFQDQK